MAKIYVIGAFCVTPAPASRPGFDVFREYATHDVRVATISIEGASGLMLACAEADRRYLESLGPDDGPALAVHAYMVAEGCSYERAFAHVTAN